MAAVPSLYSSREWAEVRILVLNRDGWVCRMVKPDGTQCGVVLHGRNATVDHDVPVSRGGAPLDPQNLRAACRHHNSSKQARIPAAAVRPSREW